MPCLILKFCPYDTKTRNTSHNHKTMKTTKTLSLSFAFGLYMMVKLIHNQFHDNLNLDKMSKNNSAWGSRNSIPVMKTWSKRQDSTR